MYFILFLTLFLHSLTAQTEEKKMSSPTTIQKMQNRPQKFMDIVKILEDKKKVYHDQMKMIGTWKTVVWNDQKKPLKSGDKSSDISIIRFQLKAYGYVDETDPLKEDDLFDEHLEKSLKQFQKDHSLDVDGIYGRHTAFALNVDFSKRLEILEKTITYLKNLKEKKNDHLVLLNIPTFTLHVFDGENMIMTQKTIVGMKSRPTPVMETKIFQIVLNPSWYVPSSIFFKDKLNKILEDDGYLETYGYRLFDFEGNQIHEDEVDWQEISTSGHLPYVLEQKPGLYNALGQIKFALDNPDAIHLHGTPSQHLFERGRRLLSSGCIRTEDPLRLALWIFNLQDLKRDQEWILKKIDLQSTQYFPLEKPIPVFIIDLEAFVNQKGDVIFGFNPYESIK